MIKKIEKLILIIAIFFVATEKVFGNQKYVQLKSLKDETGQQIYRNANGEEHKQFLILIKSYDEETEYVGYCLDVGATLVDQESISQLDTDLKGYINKALENDEQAKETSNKINEYIHFGYKYNEQNSDKYLIATQKLIWDELYNAGYRQNYYSSDAYFTSGGNTFDISSEINKIKENVANYYKTPSMCSSTNKLEIAVGETATYEDTNNVLSNYKVTCDDGITCQIEDNKLKITATSEGSEHKIIFTKEGPSEDSNVIYKKNDGQGVLVNAGKIEDVSCTFGIDTYKNVQTSGTKTIYIVITGMLCGTIAYITYYTKRTLNGLK